MSNLKNIFTSGEVIKGLPVGLTVFYYEAGVHVLYTSDEAGRILGYSALEYIELFENSMDKIFEDRLKDFECELEKLIPGGKQLNYTINTPNKYGEYRLINLCASVEIREGYRVYYLVSKDVSGLKEELDRRASTDAMTGLFNRGAFEEHFSSKVKTFIDTEEHAFILVDIDNFKNINDTYGHQQGDKAISIVADVLKKNFREHDLVARLGGDEFAIVFWNAKNKENIKNRIEMIFDNLSKEKKQLDSDINISISIGVACYPHDGSNFEELYKNADKELYKVKREDKGSYSIAG